MRVDPELVLVCRRRREGVCICALALDKTVAAPNIIEVAARDGEFVLVCRGAQLFRFSCREPSVAAPHHITGEFRDPDLVRIRLHSTQGSRDAGPIKLFAVCTSAGDIVCIRPEVDLVLV